MQHLNYGAIFTFVGALAVASCGGGSPSTLAFAVLIDPCQRTSVSRKAASRANGSKPTTRGASATKLESALMS